MNTIAKADSPRIIQAVEILTGRDRVRVLGLAHPFRGARTAIEVPAGLSIADILDRALPDAAALANREWRDRLLVDVVDSEGRSASVTPDWWPRVRPKPGATVTFRATVGDSGVLRNVLGVVIAVAAVVASVLLPPLIGPLFAALASAGIVLGGTLALNALFPIRPPQLANQQGFAQLSSIAGANNQAAPYEAIPVVLGRHRRSPNIGAKPYTEIVGDDQWLRMLFVWGYGPLTLSDFKIGETPLANFPDCQVEHREGLPGDAPVTLYPSSVDEQGLNVELTSVADWQSRVTAADCDGFSYDVTAPEGIFRIDDNGNPVARQVDVEVQYRPAAGGDFTPLPNLAFARSTGAERRGNYVAVARGQYELRMRKGTPDADDVKIKDKVVWTALRSFVNENPLAFAKPLALTAVRIRATDQLSGVLDTFNGIAVARVTSFDGAAWVADTASQWPADLFRHVLQGPANAQPVPDVQIDLDSLEDWWRYCVENGFKFNRVIEQRGSVWDTLADIAAAGRAVPTFIDGKWGVIWDRPNDPVVQHFTPRNSWGFSGERPYPRLPHGWRVQFINEANGFTQDERLVYDDGYDAMSATLFEKAEFPGVTDPDLIWRFGRFHLAQVRLRPEKIMLSTAWEHLVCQRGDRVRVTHDVLLIGQVSGRVKSVAGQVVTLDETVTIEEGKTYGIRFRLAGAEDPEQRSIVRAVDLADLEAGDYTALTLVGDLGAVEAGAVFGFGETDEESAVYRVYSIAHQKDLIATLVLVDDAPAIADADAGAIPPYDPNVTLPVDPFTLPVRDLRYAEIIDGYGAAVRALARLSWQVPRFGKITGFEVQFRDEDAGGDWTRWEVAPAPRCTSDVPVINAGLWSFRVRCLFADNTASDWSVIQAVHLSGLLLPPDDIANFRDTFDSVRSTLTWDPIDDHRTLFYEIRKGASWNAGLVVGERLAQPKFQTIGDDTYWIAAYVVTPFGQLVYSETPQSLTITGSVLTQNVIVEHDEQDEGWTGTFGGSTARDDDLGAIRTSGSDSFLELADTLGAPSVLDSGQQGNGVYLSPYVVNAGRLSACRVAVDFEATALPVDADFLGNPELLGDPDFLKSYLTQFIRVYPMIRVSQTADRDVYLPADVFDVVAVDDIYQAGEWSAWRKWTPDVYKGWLFQLGLAFEILDPTKDAIAYALKFKWSIDVPDRLDHYQDLTVPIGGLPISFTPDGSATATPFIGGPNGEDLPHVTTTYLNAPAGYRIIVSGLTKAGCTVTVVNAAGTDVGGAGINGFVQGY